MNFLWYYYYCINDVAAIVDRIRRHSKKGMREKYTFGMLVTRDLYAWKNKLKFNQHKPKLHLKFWC